MKYFGCLVNVASVSTACFHSARTLIIITHTHNQSPVATPPPASLINPLNPPHTHTSRYVRTLVWASWKCQNRNWSNNVDYTTQVRWRSVWHLSICGINAALRNSHKNWNTHCVRSSVTLPLKGHEEHDTNHRWGYLHSPYFPSKHFQQLQLNRNL